MESNFVQLFDDMVMFGALGVYQRDSTKEMTQSALSGRERLEERGMKAIHKAITIGAYLNMIFHKELEGKSVFPHTESELFRIFQEPMYLFVDSLPEILREELEENAEYCNIEPLFQSTGEGIGYTTEEMDYFISEFSFEKVCRCRDALGELREQQIFRLMYEGEYNFLRSFLEEPENAAIPLLQLDQTADQRRFIADNTRLLELCYRKESSRMLYQCPKCKAILQEDKKGNFTCLRSACNAFLDKKKPLKAGAYYVMNPYIVKSIYHPGILERRIKQVLDSMVSKKKIQSYELWPGEYPGEHDTWDFSVLCTDGEIIYIDAKDVKHPHWLINDKRVLKGEAPFWYVVPDETPRAYLNQVNRNSRVEPQVQCMRLKNFADRMEALN